MRTGGLPPSVSIAAPISRSGRAALSIGRCISVPDQLAVEGLGGEQAHEQAHRRSGVTHVEARRRRAQATQADAVHAQRSWTRALDPHPERLYGTQRGEAVLAVEEALDFGQSVSERAEHQRAVRDRLVAGHVELAGHELDRAHGPGRGDGAAHDTARG
jgi:hypothetical protein